MKRTVECKPFHKRKRGDFGYCTTVETFIYKQKDNLKFYKEKLDEAICDQDKEIEDVFRKATEIAQKELDKLNKEKLEYCDNTDEAKAIAKRRKILFKTV